MRKVFTAKQKTIVRRNRADLYDSWCDGNDGRTPEKKQKRCYSGKKKRHTLKEQLIICEDSQEIIATFFGKGKTHDYKLYEKSGVKFAEEVGIKADSGYQGLQKKPSESVAAKEAKQVKEVDQRGKASQSGVGEKTNQSGKCDPAVKDISDISRALPKSEKTTRT